LLILMVAIAIAVPLVVIASVKSAPKNA